MIRTENLTKKFKDFVAVDQVNLRVAAGEVLALLGPNGAGKTTTVRMLTSVLHPTSGRAYVAGFDVLEHPEKVRASVGVLTEQHGLYNRMRAREYLEFFASLYGMDQENRRQKVTDILEKFGLNKVTQKRIGEYSKGMRQKLALARALIHDPPVLLLDEPTSAMDPESARLVRDSIKDLRSEDRAIVICTHNLVEAEELADKIAIIRNGKIIAHGSPKSLKRLFLGPPIYELRLAKDLNGYKLKLPKEIHITERGLNWFRYRVHDPKKINPQILKSLLYQNIPVLSLQEIPQNLEQVYMQAIMKPKNTEVFNAP
ncbi:MAG: ABC transporter ATP-binding protein [Anaerolineales bacterium]|nr:ABC transporter ATP-binding protein [Anaerolineales bacterium]